MEKWLNLLTFKNPAEAHLIKTKLESQGIGVFLKNEYTAQLVPHGSDPAGPIKMRIHENNLDEAVKILKESGHLTGEKEQPPRSALIKTMDVLTGKIPGVRNQPLKLRVILSVAVVLVIIVVIYSLLALPGSV